MMKTKTKVLARISIALLILFSIAMSYFGLLAKRNYDGYCASAGKILSEEEKIRSAVTHLLKQYPPAVIRKSVASDVSSLSAPKTPIYYKDLNDFFSVNPACCKITSWREPMEEGSPNFMKRVTGTVSGFVVIDYQVRYIGDDGLPRSVLSKNHLPVSNCGKITHFWLPEDNWVAGLLGFDPHDLSD